MRQSAIDLVDIRNPQTVRLSTLLEHRVKNEISLKNPSDDPESNHSGANPRASLDPHSVLICALRSAIGSAERKKQPKNVLQEDGSGNCKLTG